MNYGLTLIDKCGEICGSFYKLAKRTGFAEQTISNIRTGKRDIPMEWVPVLADIAGVDPREALALVLAERLPEGSPARAILEKPEAGGVEMLPFSYNGSLKGAVAEIAKRLDMLYIVSIRKLTVRVVQSLTWGVTPYPTSSHSPALSLFARSES